jgi:AmpD protein
MKDTSAINTESGLLINANNCLSPNYDNRPDQADISLIVIHNISLPPNEFGGKGVEQLFLNKLDKNEHPFYEEIYHLRVSSHLLIRRDGEIIQFVPFHKRAWHAGESVFLGRDVCNDFSIGIEMEGSDFEAFTEEQYVSLEATLNDLLEAYPSLSAESITGHEHIAPGRKTDPGPFFEWKRLAKSMKVTLPARCHKLNEK